MSNKKSHQEICRIAGPTLSGSTTVWTTRFDSFLRGGGWRRAGLRTSEHGSRMELGIRALPLTRGQLDIWLAQGSGRFGAKWQLGELLRIEGAVDPGLLERAIVQVVGEAEPLRASFFEVDGRVFQKPVDYPGIELARYDLTGSADAAQAALRKAHSIQRPLMSL